MLRGLLFLLIALAVFLPFNYLTAKQLLRNHPRRKRWIVGAVIAGNLMWPFFLLLGRMTAAGRITRATLGPIWFGWTSFAIVYSAVIAIAFIAWLPFHKRAPLVAFTRWPSRVFIAITIVATIAGIYQALVPLRVERVPIVISNLPPSLEGTRIALLSDLHVGLFTRPSRLTKIFAMTVAEKPAAILLAGDLIDDDPYFVPKLLDATAAIPGDLPLYAVLGNHEIYGDPDAVVGRMSGSRVRLLVNEGAALGPLWIAGISDYAAGQRGLDRLKPDLQKALSAMPPGSLPVVLAHQPKAFDDARHLGVKLTLCGHTHGGQLGCRPLGWSLAGVFLPRHMGLYRESGSQLYINTGTGYWLVPFRLGMTPEITIVELRGR